MQIDIGIDQAGREKIAQRLSILLADSYTLYLKTHSYHWNVTGPMFVTLHTLFEEHYTDLSGAVDEIAERIRALGVRAPGSYQEYSSLTSIKEEAETPAAEKMIENLVLANETVIKVIRESFEIADAENDQATLDLLTRRTEVHEKNAWMLRSLLAK